MILIPVICLTIFNFVMLKCVYDCAYRKGKEHQAMYYSKKEFKNEAKS